MIPKLMLVSDLTKGGREAGGGGGGSGLDLHSPEKLRTIAETALEVGR